MAFADDPFPSSLPSLDSPGGLDSTMAGIMEDVNVQFFSSAMSEDSPGPLYVDDPLPNSPYRSPIRHNPPAMQFAMVDSDDSPSPQSSLHDSSSDSSGRHKRHNSSNSSRSILLGRDATMAEWKPDDLLLADDRKNAPLLDDTNVAFSDQAMENDFDFESAASSPSGCVDSKKFVKNRPRDDVHMPYRPFGAPGVASHHHFKPNTRGIPPLSAITESQSISPPILQHAHGLPSGPNDYVSGAMLNETSQIAMWPYNPMSVNHDISSSAQSTNFKPPAMNGHFMSPSASSRPAYGSFVPTSTLTIDQTPAKSRVETQIPIKLTLCPVPPGITKLHLPPECMSKPKLQVKPTPARSAEMAELTAMLVCTSAMQDITKTRRAFARAAGTASATNGDSRRLSSGDVPLADDDENQPLNGGPVNICVGCITRERKRAARKKSKKPEEEESWQKDEAKRIIVFNTQEVKEWQQPSQSKARTSAGGSNSQSTGESGTESPPLITLPEGAMQVDVPMRIACYCRHQNEKYGFQVIFTIKDYQDVVIAQAMTNPIIITDDHKTHAPPTAMPPSAMFTGAGVFAREPISNYSSSGMYRQSLSTTDLERLQQNHNPQPMQQMTPFSMPSNASQSTSTTLTPRNLSRQASPSAPSQPNHKRRKPSGSGRLPDGLTMTRLQTSQPPTMSNAGTPSAATSPFAPTYGPPSYDFSTGSSISSMPSHFSTGPPTPNGTENGLFALANRSQSMENLSRFPQMFSAPSSARPSRVPSPTTGPRPNNGGLPQGDVQAVMNSFYQFPPSMNSQRPPTIHRLVPGKGSKSGGMEIICLGSGFCPGLEVMFGDSLATTTTYWGETTLVCLLPPAIQAGVVQVTFKHIYQQQLQTQRYSSPHVPKQLAYFEYIDDDEEELMRQALAIVNSKVSGRADPREIAQRLINVHAHASGTGAWTGGSTQSGDQQRQSFFSNSSIVDSMDLETALLSCLDLIDLDDSPYKARLNLQRSNGQSMLHLSASLGYHRLLAGLLARGANPDLRDKNGMSPMHMASLRGHAQIVRRLCSAGADPTLRSLRGYTPIDMASSQEVSKAISIIGCRPRPRSAGATSFSRESRSSSTNSFSSSRHAPSLTDSVQISPDYSDDEDLVDEGVIGAARVHPMTPAQLWAQSRRNSIVAEQTLITEHSPENLAGDARGLAAPAALAAWRDQLAAQIQQFQNSVPWTLPHLQLPTLPPMPNLPDYQANPMVRRISSLVPRHSRPGTSSDCPQDGRESESNWWDLFRSTSYASAPPPPEPSPPAYEEIYPQEAQQDLDTKKSSALIASADAALDEKCALNFDQAEIGRSAESSSTTEVRKGQESGVTWQENKLLVVVQSKKKTKIQNDKKLFVVWLPILFAVICLWLWEGTPKLCEIVWKAIAYYQERSVCVL